MADLAIDGLDREAISGALWGKGFAPLGSLLPRKECEALRALYDDEARFRSRIDMAHYRFGRGEYQYFSHPLPARVAELRTALYGLLAPIARSWCNALGLPAEFPDRLDAFLKRCHAEGQIRPTPLLLRYRQGDYNCLHQDLYGTVVFPFQVIVGLSEPGREFTGGELLLVEQRPRAQSVGQVLTLAQGEAVAITTRYRPLKGMRGFSRAAMRHGVSEVRSGERVTLGLIFHDAE